MTLYLWPFCTPFSLMVGNQFSIYLMYVVQVPFPHHLQFFTARSAVHLAEGRFPAPNLQIVLSCKMTSNFVNPKGSSLLSAWVVQLRTLDLIMMDKRVVSQTLSGIRSSVSFRAKKNFYMQISDIYARWQSVSSFL